LLFHALHDAIAGGLLLAEIGHLPPPGRLAVMQAEIKGTTIGGIIGTIMRGQ
jgi:hypothetical protein